MCKLNKLKHQCVKEEITKEIRKYLEMDENTTYESIWDTVKAEGNLPKFKKSKINLLTLYFNGLKKKSKINPKLIEGRK